MDDPTVAQAVRGGEADSYQTDEAAQKVDRTDTHTCGLIHPNSVRKSVPTKMIGDRCEVGSYMNGTIFQ